MLIELTNTLIAGNKLSDGEVALAVQGLTDERLSAEVKAGFLTALANKGESPAELAAFAGALRELSIFIPLDAATRQRDILDVCGTGGDRLHTFNISSTVAIIAAAAGITVAKHGNRAITSQSGSADVLEALNIRVDLSPDEAAQALREHHFAFLFAPRYHPAFKHIAPARKLCAERGQRTIFNFLGPLLNPARPTCQLIGVPAPTLCEHLARTLQTLGIRRGMVVSGKVPLPDGTVAGLDELSTLGESTVAEFYQERALAVSSFDPACLPLQPATLNDLAGGDKHTNAAIMRRILRGEERGPKREAVLLNAGAALFVAGRVKSIAAGWEFAASLIDDGAAARKLHDLQNAFPVATP
ncbi:MAG: anthranilate phosphoribosyltransferase [Verrucomicrobiota bacterium]